MSDSPLTLDSDYDENEVQSVCFARVLMTDEEWDEEGEHEWDLSREEAADRIDTGDFSVPSQFRRDEGEEE